MVFVCNNCADVLKKDEVAKHYRHDCHEDVSLACKSCLQEFGEDNYLTHTQCTTKSITDKKKSPSKKSKIQIVKEEETLQNKGSKVQNVKVKEESKGARQQNMLLGVVQSVLETEKSLSKQDKAFLSAIIKNKSLPRTRVKLQNFGKTLLQDELNSKVVDHVWDLLEEKIKLLTPRTENKNNEEIKHMNLEENEMLLDSPTKKKKSGKKKYKNVLEEKKMLLDSPSESQKSKKKKKKEIVSTPENGVDKKTKKRDIHEAGLEEREISKDGNTNTDVGKKKKIKTASNKMNVSKAVNNGTESDVKRRKKKRKEGSKVYHT